MKTLSSIFIALIAIAFAVYNNEYMLSRLTQSLKHVTSLAKTTKPLYNTTQYMTTIPVMIIAAKRRYIPRP